MSFSRNENWTKTSWMNDMVTSPKFAKDLTSIYADDIIQAVEEDRAFPTISAAIDDLKSRTGLGEAEAINLRKVAAYGIDPKLHNAIENLATLEPTKVAKLLKAYMSKCVDCTATGIECAHILSANAKRAINEVGFNVLAARVEDFAKIAKKEENKAKWGEFSKKAAKNSPLDSKAWFQGSETPVDKIVSNDPDKLGYPGEVGYARQPMAVPVGGDSRDWEQSWFEGAANETQKVMGPKGSELAEKKEWQRIAARKAAMERVAKTDTPECTKTHHHTHACGMGEGEDKDEKKDKSDKKAAWTAFMNKKAGGMNPGFKAYLDKKNGKDKEGCTETHHHSAACGMSEDSDKTPKKEEKKASRNITKKAELVFPQEVYSALQQMTGSVENISSQLKTMIDAINADQYSGAEESAAAEALPELIRSIGEEEVAKWLVENINTDEALAHLQEVMNNVRRRDSHWSVTIKKSALKRHSHLLKAAEIAPDDINQLTEKAGERLAEVSNVLRDFKSSKDRLGKGEDQFVGEMAREYTERLNKIIDDRGLASRIIDVISKSAEKASSLIYIIDDLLKYEK